MKNLKLLALLVALGALVLQAPAHADQIDLSFNASFDTAALQNQGQFELAFLLTDGSGTGDHNTTITISNFQFGTGGTGGGVTSDSEGGFSGNLSTGVTLIDSSFFNLFGANFTPGNQLSFAASIVSTSLDSPTPDLFEFVILNSSGSPVPTTDPSGQNALITVNLDSISPAVQTNSISTPEPSLSVFLTSGLIILGLVHWRRIKRRVTE